MKYDIPTGAQRILQGLNEAGYEAYLVGGCVRDLLRNVLPHDWDICTSAQPGQVEACFADLHIIETGLKHGTLTIMDSGEPYEITTYRMDGHYSDGRHPDSVRFVPSLREDLARRDFTMNAIAMDINGDIQDPFHGVEDIQAGIIRCVGDPDNRFQEDGLRVMRALRFASTFHYDIEKGTAAAVHRNRDMLSHVAAERINTELCRLLVGGGVGRVLRDYPDVFCVFWPDLAPLVAMEQNNPWHCWGGWEHTIHAIEGARPDVVLRLTMLLHDIGKPATKTTDEDGIDHFYGHPAISAVIAEKMLKKLKFDNDTYNHVITLVRNHDKPIEPRDKVIRRLLNQLGPEDFYLLLEVHRADNLGQAPELAQDRIAQLEIIKAMADEIIAQQQCFSLKDLAISGHDLLDLGAIPGPQVGVILNMLLEQVMSEDLPNELQALQDAAKQLLAKGDGCNG